MSNPRLLAALRQAITIAESADDSNCAPLAPGELRFSVQATEQQVKDIESGLMSRGPVGELKIGALRWAVFVMELSYDRTGYSGQRYTLKLRAVLAQEAAK